MAASLWRESERLGDHKKHFREFKGLGYWLTAIQTVFGYYQVALPRTHNNEFATLARSSLCLAHSGLLEKRRKTNCLDFGF